MSAVFQSVYQESLTASTFGTPAKGNAVAIGSWNMPCVLGFHSPITTVLF